MKILLLRLLIYSDSVTMILYISNSTEYFCIPEISAVAPKWLKSAPEVRMASCTDPFITGPFKLS